MISTIYLKILLYSTSYYTLVFYDTGHPSCLRFAMVEIILSAAKRFVIFSFFPIAFSTILNLFTNFNFIFTSTNDPRYRVESFTLPIFPLSWAARSQPTGSVGITLIPPGGTPPSSSSSDSGQSSVDDCSFFKTNV